MSESFLGGKKRLENKIRIYILTITSRVENKLQS